MSGPYTPPKLVDIPVPDLFTLVAQQNSQRPFVQIIHEPPGTTPECSRFTWADVIHHAQNAATDLRIRWAENPSMAANKQLTGPRLPGSPPTVVGLLANNGYELYVNIIACLLNRWTALLISPKNSPAAIEHLLAVSHCALFLVDASNLALGRMMVHTIPGLHSQTIANVEPSATDQHPSPLTSITPEQLKTEMQLPAFYLHTSGSTGHPKIVPGSHEFVLSGTRSRRTDSEQWIGLHFYCMAPIIHSMGIIVYFQYAMAHANLMTFISSPNPKPPSGASLLTHLPFIKGGIVLLPPSILEDLYNLGPDAVKEVAEGTRLVVSGGAPLNVMTGNALVAGGIELSSGWGTTEIGIGTRQLSTKKPEDWRYVQFRNGYDLHFLPIDGHPNLRELIVGPGTDGCPAVINHENPYGYATNDIWKPHPTLPDLWEHHSRKGDVTVLSNGEKSDNKQIEELLLRDRRILHVQVFGAGRPLNGVIIQPADTSVPTSEFLAQIQSTILHANSVLPKHSRLVPQLVIPATFDRAFETTDKGTVKRKETLEMFKLDIENAYNALDNGAPGSEWNFEGNGPHDLKRFVRRAVQTVIGNALPDEDDLFEHGFDSLLSMQLRMALMSAVKKTPMASQPIPRNIVYTFPSINALTAYLLSLMVSEPSNASDGNQERILRSISRFSTNFISHTPGLRVVPGNVVALSGSTGSLGSSILRLLLEEGDVTKIYLLNRKGRESQELRQARSFREKAFDPMILETKKELIVYLDVDLSKRDLGLSEINYKELQDNVHHIIHAAWHLNFNLILESYEHMHIAGVRHLVDLALSSPQAKPPRITLLSTIAAVGMYRGPTKEPTMGDRAGQVLVPEAPIDDPSIAFNQGYGQSKYVSERVLVRAVEAGLRTTIIRVGQLSGGTTNGAWATSEHVPIMLISSLALGVVPEDLPSVRWIPSNIAALAVIKQAFSASSVLEYFSIENPFPTPWNDIVQALSSISSKPLRPVTLAAWLELIRESNPDPKEVPATKLLDFYQSRIEGGSPTVALGWERSVRLVPELAVGPIPTDLIKRYILYQQSKARDL